MLHIELIIYSFISSLFILKNNGTCQHTLRKLPSPINSNYFNEISPILSQDEKTLHYTRIGSPQFNKTLIIDSVDVFTSSENLDIYYDKLASVYSMIANKEVLDPVNSHFNQEVFSAKINFDTVYNYFHHGYPLNNALPNSICSRFGNIGNSYLVLNQFMSKGGMIEGFSIVDLDENNNCSFPISLNVDEFAHIGENINATLSKDRQHLFIAMMDQVTNSYDLFLSLKHSDSTYSKPKPISSINTDADEITPFISNDKKKLYFASNRDHGIGGFDIYVCERLDYSYLNWSAPKLLNQPINSVANESYPYTNNDESQMYFVSDKEGNNDIYCVKLIRSNERKRLKINIKAVKEDGSQFPSEIYWGEAYQNENWDGYFRARNGEHTIYIEENKPIVIVAENRNLITNFEVIDPQEYYDQNINEINVRLVLGERNRNEKVVELVHEENIFSQMKEGSVTTLNNIYFKIATDSLLANSYESIQELANVLKRNPQIKIRVEGHTDNVGSKNDLLILSKSRADKIRKLLIENGVVDDQIEAKGFGDTKPLNDNSTEERKQQNRRVEIRLIKKPTFK